MKSDFLKNIDSVLKENNFELNSFYYPIERFPDFFKKALYKLADKYSRINKLDPYCSFVYDKNGILVLLVTFNNDKTNVLIVDNNAHLEFDNPVFKFIKIDIDSLINHAAKLELFVRICSDFRFNSKTKLDLNTARELTKLLFNNYDVSSMIDEKRVEEELDSIVPVICDYALYLNDYYKAEPQKKEVLYYEPHEEMEPLTTGKRGPSDNKSSSERKNEIMSIDDRNEMLSNLGNVDFIEARSMANDDVYYCYLYPMGENEYKMIAEPISGQRYTKVFYFKIDGVPKDKVLETAILKYLPLTDRETLESKYIIRINHTSLENFKKSISFAIKLDSKLFKVRSYLKENVLKAQPDTLTYEEPENELTYN